MGSRCSSAGPQANTLCPEHEGLYRDYIGVMENMRETTILQVDMYAALDTRIRRRIIGNRGTNPGVMPKSVVYTYIYIFIYSFWGSICMYICKLR